MRRLGMLRLGLVVMIIVALVGSALAQQDKERTSKKKRRAPPRADQSLAVRKEATVQSVAPESGAPGTTVTIHGQNFDDTTQVRFNGKALPVASRSHTELKVRLPPTAVSDSFVVSKAGFPDVTTEQTFHVVRPPSISSFTPTRGGSGTEVTVVGASFLPTDTFVLGAAELRASSVRPTRAVVEITGAAASGKLGVKRGDKVVAWSKATFDVSGKGPVIVSFAPQRGPTGTVVRLTGKNLEGSDWVELGGDKLAVRGRSATHIDVLIAASHSSGSFVLQGREGRRAESSGSFTVVRPLAVKGFAPAFGPPRTRITIDGAGFTAGDAPHLGEAMLTVRSLSDSAIVAELPAGVAGGAVCVRRGAQKLCARGKFEVTLGPVISAISPPAGAPGAPVVIQGRNFSPDVQVLLAGQRLAIIKKKLPEQLTVAIPTDARSGQIVVVTRAGTAQSPVTFKITQHAEVTSFFPLHALPGAKVTLRGSHFHLGIKAFLGDTELKEVSRTEEALVVQIPAAARPGPARLMVETYGKKLAMKIGLSVDEAKPEFEFSFAPAAGRRGTEVTLTLTPPTVGVRVFFDGRPLSTNELQGGKLVVVTIPSDARTGHFEVEHAGQRYKAKLPFKVR